MEGLEYAHKCFGCVHLEQDIVAHEEANRAGDADLAAAIQADVTERSSRCPGLKGLISVYPVSCELDHVPVRSNTPHLEGAIDGR